MISKLKNLVASGKASEAINLIVNQLSKSDKDRYNNVILLSGQIARNHGLFSQGLIKLEEYKLSESQTTRSLLSILDSIESKEMQAIESDSKEETEVEKKTKLLFLASQPSDMETLQLEKEYLEIRKIFKKFRKSFDVTEEFDVTIDTFFESINEQTPHIIHFSGHSSNDNILLSRKIDRVSHEIPYEFLASSFKLLKDSTELVFINTMGSCLFAKVISRFIPYAIGVKGNVSDIQAISFSSGFYSALAIEKDYEKAFEFGKMLLNPISWTQENLSKENESDDKILKEDKNSFNGYNEDPNIYYLFSNGQSKDDSDTPEDFYSPQPQPPAVPEIR